MTTDQTRTSTPTPPPGDPGRAHVDDTNDLLHRILISVALIRSIQPTNDRFDLRGAFANVEDLTVQAIHTARVDLPMADRS